MKCNALAHILTVLVFFVCWPNSNAQITRDVIPYYPDETIDYSLKYGFFKIGEAHLEFNYDRGCKGAYILAYAKSSGLLKLFKNIFYQYECCMDSTTGLPITDSRILIEGDYSDKSTVYYDHLSRKDSSLVFSRNTGTLVVPKNIYDLLSGFYYYRANYLRSELPMYHSFTTTTFFIDEVRDLTVTYCGKESIRTTYGTIECLKVKPVTIVGHFFRTSDAMTIWFADQGEYIPVKFEINFKLGTLYGDIINSKKPIL